MKGKARHVTFTPPPFTAHTHKHTHSRLLCLDPADPVEANPAGTISPTRNKKAAVTAAEIIVFPTVPRCWRTPLHCPPQSHDWKADFFSGAEPFF